MTLILSVLAALVILAVIGYLSLKLRANDTSPHVHEQDEEFGPDDDTPPWMQRLP